MTVSQRLLIPVLLFFTIVLIALVGAFTVDRSNNVLAQEEAELAQLHQSFLDKIDSMETLALSLATSAANNPEIKRTFAAGDREGLIGVTHPSYLAIKDQFDVAEYQFHVPIARSFLRVNRLSEYGDDLSGFRFTVLDANLDRRPVSGLEIGRTGLSARGVVPVQYQGKHIGTVEYGLSIDQQVLDELESNYGRDWNLIISKTPAEVASLRGTQNWETGPREDLLLQTSTMETPVFAPDEIYDQVLRRNSVISRVRMDGTEYAVLSSPLLDFNNDVIGVIQVISDRTEALAQQRQRLSIGAIVILGSLLIGGTGFTLIATRTLRSISVLTETATAIASGDLNRTVPVNGNDEIGTLARTFNSMTEQLRSLVTGLEHRVAERTQELEEAAADLAEQQDRLEKANQQMAEINQQLERSNRQSRRRATLLYAGNQVGRAASQVRELNRLLPEVTELISQNFGFYHVGIFMLDEIGRYAFLRAANSSGGKKMLARGHKLAVGQEGIIGHVTATGKARISLDVGEDAVYFDNPDLPDTRSEMAVPLRLGDQVIGALDVQSTEPNAFESEDIAALTTLADQISVSIENARLFEQTRRAVTKAEETQQRYMKQEWTRYLRQTDVPGFEYTLSGVAPAGDVPLPEIELAIEQGEPVTLDKDEHPLAQNALAVPIKFRDHVFGALGLHAEETGRVWQGDEIALVQDIAEQLGLALENARLFEATERRAQRETLVSEIVTKVRQRPDVDSIMQTAVRELGKALRTPRAFVHLTGSIETPADAAGTTEIVHEVSDDRTGNQTH